MPSILLLSTIGKLVEGRGDKSSTWPARPYRVGTRGLANVLLSSTV